MNKLKCTKVVKRKSKKVEFQLASLPEEDDAQPDEQQTTQDDNPEFIREPPRPKPKKMKAGHTEKGLFFPITRIKLNRGNAYVYINRPWTIDDARMVAQWAACCISFLTGWFLAVWMIRVGF